MRKILFYNILIIILMFSLSGEGIGSERYAFPDISQVKSTEQQVYLFSTTTKNILSLLDNSAELIPGCLHVTADSKTYIILLAVLRFCKDYPKPPVHFSPNWYFHPYSTLGKTKYYVFASVKLSCSTEFVSPHRSFKDDGTT